MTDWLSELGFYRCPRGLILVGALLGFAPTPAGVGAGLTHALPDGVYPNAYLVDATGSHGLDEVMSLSPAAWKPLTAGGVSFGYDPAIYWFTWPYRAAPASGGTDILVEIAYPMLDEIDLFAVRRQGRQWMVVDHWRMGDALPFNTRPYPHPNFVVPVRVAPGSEIQFVARVHTTSSVQVPVRLWSEAAFSRYVQLTHLSMGAFIGALASLLFYYFAVWVTLREPLYLYFLIWMVFAGSVVVTLNGVGFQYLWPGTPLWNEFSLVISLIVASASGVAFSAEVSREAVGRNSSMIRARNPILVLSGLILVVALLAPYRIGVSLAMLTALFSFVFSIVLALAAARSGCRPARIYLAGRFLATLAVGTVILGKFSILPNSVISDAVVMLAVGLDLVFTSLSLAPRLSEEKALRTEAQMALSQAKVNSRDQMESRVAERTRRLLEANRELSRLSLTDALTGLSNRRALTEAFARESEHARAAGQTLSIALLDVDYFKRFNDTHGHAAGDQCLRVVAREMRLQVPRNGDLAARYGGEEFCVLLPNTQLDGALIVAERIRLAIQAARVDLGVAQAHVTVSLGVHAITDWSRVRDLETAMAIVDRALYRAKASGRNRVVASMEDD